MSVLAFFLLGLEMEPALPAETWRERSGAVLTLVDGELVRERNGERMVLACTAPEGTGRVLDVALDPAGLAFVAAERGLFVLGPFVDVLDPVERRELAPQGRPTSVHVDSARRVWLATDESIGVLDPSFFFGRVLAREELPGDGPYRVDGAPGGAVLLRGTGVERVHVAAAGAAPRLTGVWVDGYEVAPSARLEREPDGELRVGAAGEADGGATFRYRFDGHQVWRELAPGATLRMPQPGAHRLEVIALDQDLDRSEPWLVRLRVAYPIHYGGRFVLTTLATGALGLFASFLLAQRARGRLRPWYALVSTALALVLALQVVAGLEPHAKGWPFMGFNMYTRAYARDEIVYDERVVVLHRDGTENLVAPQSTGFAVDEAWEILRPLIDGGEPALRAYLDSWRARYGEAGSCGLQVQARRSRLTPGGPVVIAPLVLAHYQEGPDGTAR